MRILVTNEDRVFSKALGCYLVVVGSGDAARLRLATGPGGDVLVPTADERERAERSEKERERAEKEQGRAELERERAEKEHGRAELERERAARIAAEDELSRLRTLLERRRPGAVRKRRGR